MVITRVSSANLRKPAGHYVIAVTPLNGDRPYIARGLDGKTMKFQDNVTAGIEAKVIVARLDGLAATDVLYRGVR